MSEVLTIEERLRSLEREVAELKRRAGMRETVRQWLDRISGRLSKYPEFDEVIRFGREFRQSARTDEGA